MHPRKDISTKERFLERPVFFFLGVYLHDLPIMKQAKKNTAYENDFLEENFLILD